METFSKEAVVVVCDVGASMAARPADVAKIRATAAAVLLRKLQYHKQDEVGLLLYGTAGTHNVLNHEHPGQYEHITVLQPIARPTPAVIRAINAAPADGGPADLLEALIVAGDMLHRRCNGYRFARRIFLFTDAGGEVKNKEDLEKVRAMLSRQGIALVVVGVRFRFETHHAAEEVAWEDCDTRDQNEKVLHWLCDELKGDSVVAGLDDAMAEAQGMKAAAVLQRTAFRAVLSLGEGPESFELPLHAFLYTKAAGMPQLKRASAKAKALHPGTPLTEGDAKVDIERRYFCAADLEKEVEERDRVKAFMYGQTPVPFTEVDEKALQFSGGSRGMQALCFVPRRSVPQHWLLSHTYLVVPPAKDAAAVCAFRALLRAMFETEDAMVVRLVRTDNAPPVTALAWAHIKPSLQCLYLNELPFAEDIRGWEFPPQAAAPGEAGLGPELAAAESVIRSMDLMHAAPDGGEALKPRDVFNPALQHFHQGVRKRLLEPDAPLPPLDDRARRSSCLWQNEDNVLRPMLARAEEHVERLRAAAGARLVEHADKSSKWAFWFAGDKHKGGGLPAVDKGSPAGPTPGTPAKRARADGYFRGTPGGYSTTPGGSLGPAGGAGGSAPLVATSGPDPLRAAERPPASSVGTVRPVLDFKEMVARRDGDFFLQATTGIAKVIRTLVTESIAEQFYGKALDCVLAFRAACVKEQEAEVFNSFLRALRGELLGGPRKAFWDTRLAANGVTLITDTEVGGEADAKGVRLPTVDEARAFLTDAPPAPAPAPMPSLPEDDDLFGNLD